MQRSTNTKNLIFVMVLVASMLYQTNENQHKRELYYGTQDYVCESGVPARKDIVTISLQLEDSSYNVYYADAGTTCNNMVTEPWLRVRPARSWSYYSQGKNQIDNNQIRFSQTVEYKYTRFLKRTKSIVATSKIQNPAKIGNKLYECQMQKTTLTQHFGLYGRHEPSVIFMKCQKQKQSVKQE